MTRIPELTKSRAGNILENRHDYLRHVGLLPVDIDLRARCIRSEIDRKFHEACRAVTGRIRFITELAIAEVQNR